MQEASEYHLWNFGGAGRGDSVVDRRSQMARGSRTGLMGVGQGRYCLKNCNGISPGHSPVYALQ